MRLPQRELFGDEGRFTGRWVDGWTDDERNVRVVPSAAAKQLGGAHRTGTIRRVRGVRIIGTVLEVVMAAHSTTTSSTERTLNLSRHGANCACGQNRAHALQIFQKAVHVWRRCSRGGEYL
jgi:hypothetical protein